jgi:exodeoxyribonuclease-3
MRIISANLNGIRSAAKKGFFEWLQQQNADVVCLQETRANESQLTDKIFKPTGYFTYFSEVQRKGYSGVAIFCKKKPDAIKHGLGWEVADTEGRYLEIAYGSLRIASVYLPSGTSGEVRQAIKFHFLDEFLPILQQMINDNNQYILCGDWNIAHQNIDLKNWRTNQKTSGFLPAERAWLDQLFNEVGFIDAFRYMHPDKVQYTFWSQRAGARANNVGWRIDYQIITPDLADKLRSAEVYTAENFSDHAPLIFDYDIATA